MDKIQKLRQIRVVLLIVCVLGRGCSTNANFAHLKCSGLVKLRDCEGFGWAKYKNRHDCGGFGLALFQLLGVIGVNHRGQFQKLLWRQLIE